MSITHNGKEYGATKVINYSAAPDYNRGIAVNNIQTGNYQANDNGFLLIQLQSQQSNPTKVSVVRSKTPITSTGTEIASIVLSQYQYSETLTAQVMAREYYKLTIDGAGNPQVLSCVFYPYATNVPIKLTEDISIEQVDGLESELAGKQDVGDYATSNELTQGLATKQDAGDYATNTALNDGLATKQDKGNYFNKDKDVLSEKNGGTGTDNGLNFKNVYSWLEFLELLGLRDEDAPFTIQQLIDKINILPLNSFEFSFYFWGESLTIPEISYGKISSNIMTVKKVTTNVLEFTFLYGVNGSIFKMYTNNSIANNFYLARGNNGSIPAELISLPVGFSYIQANGTGTPDTVFNTTGKWQEITSTATGFPSGTRIWKKIS